MFDLENNEWNCFLAKPKPKNKTVAKNLTQREQQVYDQVTSRPNFEQCLKELQTTFTQLFPHRGCKISGRVIDTAMTKFPKTQSAFYYIDYSTKPTTFVDAEDFAAYTEAHKNHDVRLFCLQSAYKLQMSRYTKTFFDMFGRGKLYTYKGTTFSLCRINYYMWAKEHHVFEYLKRHYKTISQLQKQDQLLQKAHRQEKRKYGKIQKKKLRSVHLEAVFKPFSGKPSKAPNLLKYFRDGHQKPHRF